MLINFQKYFCKHYIHTHNKYQKTLISHGDVYINLNSFSILNHFKERIDINARIFIKIIILNCISF